MLLAIDIGNTNMVIGFFDGDKLLSSARIATDRDKTADEYAIVLRNVALLYEIDRRNIDGAIISSVVPPLTSAMRRAIRTVFSIHALTVGPGIKTGLDIRIDDPSVLGADLVCGSVAAIAKYPLPAIVVDLGTATKFSALDSGGSYLGCSIMPGIQLSLDALSHGTAQLPHISFDVEPPSVIGTNSVDSMRAGILFGSACMIDGMLGRFRELLGEPLTVIATGGHAEVIVPHCRSEIIHDPSLLLDGLRILHDKNRRG